jgi:hypothetical protein
MVDSTTEALTPKVTPLGLLLAAIGGVVAAGIMGFVYHLVANKVEIDYIIVFAVVLGAVVGFVVGLLGRLGGLRAALPVVVIGFVCGVGAYVARYVFEYNDVIDTAVQEVMQDPNVAGGVSADEVRSFILDGFAAEYPPGELIGYLNLVAESGFSIGDRNASSSGAPIQGGMAWGLLGIEALAAGLVAAAAARNQLKPKAISRVSAGPALTSTTMTDPTTYSPPSDNDPST